MVGRSGERTGDVGRSESTKGEHRVDDTFIGLDDVLALRRDDVLPEGQHGVVVGAPPRNRRRSDSGGGEWSTGHRSAAIHQQTDRRGRRRPRPDTQVVGVHRRSFGGGCDEGVETGVDVEVAAVRSVALGAQLADPARRRRPPLGDVEEQATSQPAGELAQFGVGGTGEVGEKCERVVRVLVERLGQRFLVEFADLG